MLLFLIIFGGVLFSSTLSKTEIILIDSLLKNQDFSIEDLNFEKDWSTSTKYKLPIVKKILNQPLYFPIFVDSIKVLLNKNDFPLDNFANLLIKNIPDFSFQKKLKKHPNSNELFDFVFQIYQKAFYHQQLAFITLSDDEKKKLLFLSFNLLSEDQDSTRYNNFYAENNYSKFDSLKTEDIVNLISKINFDELFIASKIVYTGFNQLINFISGRDFILLKNLKRETKFGTFIISKSGNDFYHGNYAFILDISGDDYYLTNFRTDFKHPFIMQFDLEGNDKYQSESIGGVFSSFAGVIFHADYKGNDIYYGDDYSFSSWLGYMFSFDFNGDDIYKSGLHSLGASTCGISYLYDKSGDDLYRATEFSEGFASTLGIGILQDNNGDDVYYCGGKYLHNPLAPEDYRTMSHGFGFGLRPDIGGGVGILYDKSGNDYYDGGVFSIGGAYWYALGICIDDGGNDFYNSVYYPQGSGIHLAGGFLLDEKGEDLYYSKHGPGMGAGHDYSVGFLIDKSGNDVYAVEGGLGLGLTNSVGIFIDKDGDDKYVIDYSKNCGWANKSRNSGGLGIFIDESGNDQYSNDYAKNNSYWQRGYFGFGLDKKLQKNRKIKRKKINKVAEIDSLLPIKDIFKIASGWGVNSNAKRVDRALQILIIRDKEASKYIAENKMNTKSGLTLRAIKKFAKKSKEIKKYFPELLSSNDSLVIKNTIYIISELKDTTYIPYFERFLKEKKYEKTVLSALGNLKSIKSVKLLSKYVNSKNRKYRIIVARSLFKIDTPDAKRELRKLKKDKSFLIKAMFKIKKYKEN